MRWREGTKDLQRHGYFDNFQWRIPALKKLMFSCSNEIWEMFEDGTTILHRSSIFGALSSSETVDFENEGEDMVCKCYSSWPSLPEITIDHWRYQLNLFASFPYLITFLGESSKHTERIHGLYSYDDNCEKSFDSWVDERGFILKNRIIYWRLQNQSYLTI